MSGGNWPGVDGYSLGLGDPAANEALAFDSSIAVGNLLFYDWDVLALLAEWTRPPVPYTEVQTIAAYPFNHGASFPVASHVPGNVMVFPFNAHVDSVWRVQHIDGSDGSVTEYISAADAWDGISLGYILAASKDTANRYIVAYQNAPGSFDARRFNTDGTILDTTTLEATIFEYHGSGFPLGAAISPTGQYVYALLVTEDIGSFDDDWTADLVQFDLDNAGARSVLKTYTFNRATNSGHHLGLGCGPDGSIYVGYWTANLVVAPGVSDDTHTFLIDRLNASGGVQATVQVLQYVYPNTASNELAVIAGIEPVLSVTGNFLHTFFTNNVSGIIFPGGQWVVEINLATEAVTLTDWRTETESYTTGQFTAFLMYGGGGEPGPSVRRQRTGAWLVA